MTDQPSPSNGLQMAGSLLAALLIAIAAIYSVNARLGPTSIAERRERAEAAEERREQAEEAAEEAAEGGEEAKGGENRGRRRRGRGGD